MTRVWKMVLMALIAGTTIFAVACGGGEDKRSAGKTSDSRISGNETSVSQQVQHQDLEECPRVARDMRCVVRSASVTADENSYVVAREGSTVYAFGGSHVEAYPSSRVIAYKGSTVRWRYGADVSVEEDGVDVERVTYD